jgi:phosphatidylglycerophosphate synthase
MHRLLTPESDHPGTDDPAVQAAAGQLARGALLGLPTETVYGLAADACRADAVQRIFAAKGRPENHPLIVHVAGSAQVADYAAEVPAFAQRLIEPVLSRLARRLVALKVTANQLTLAGFAIGLLAAALIAQGAYRAGLLLLLLSRLCDGLDGAVARQTQPTDRGGFLDITLDFIFYAAVVLAFAFADPAANALAAAALLAGFMGTGSSFLAFAVMAAKRQVSKPMTGGKSFYFLGGLTEGTETLGFFVAMCLWPAQFALLAWFFAGLCVLTTISRVVWGCKAFD